MRKTTIHNGIKSKHGHDKKSSNGPELREKLKRHTTSKKTLKQQPSQARIMAYQDEIVNRRQKEEIVHARHVLLNSKKKQEVNKTFVS